MIQEAIDLGEEGTMQSYREVLDRLTRAQPSLSPQLRKVAAYVLENPGDVATLSMRQVAAAAEVPPPTMPRLAKVVGFESYNAFREVYQRDLSQRTVAYSQEAGRLQERPEGDDMASLWSAFKQASLSNMEQLFAALDGELIAEVAERLIAARRVYVTGMQASFSFANYFQYVGFMARPNWVLLSNRNGVLADHAFGLGAEDALVAIAIEPCARDTIRLAQMAQERGATVVGITNSRTTALAARSSIVLPVPAATPQFFESYVSTTALLEALIGFVVAKSDREVLDNIERLELSRRDLGEYWEER
ncbi:MAG: MurR/RpiR family transcriptional regulator [Pseudomonadota bacterium]